MKTWEIVFFTLWSIFVTCCFALLLISNYRFNKAMKALDERIKRVPVKNVVHDKLRAKCYEVLPYYLKDFKDPPDELITLSELLGYQTFVDMLDFKEEKDIPIMESLIGPHGYSIFKMLIIKRNLQIH
jgi:hypothetical protein